MSKNVSVATVILAAGMLAASIVLANSADRINPPAARPVETAASGRMEEAFPDADPVAARGALRRMLTVRAAAVQAPAAVPVRDTVPAPAKAPKARRIAKVGAVTGEDGVTTYWFRDLDGTAIYPLSPGGGAVDGWRLLSIGDGTAELSIDGETYQVKEK